MRGAIHELVERLQGTEASLTTSIAGILTVALQGLIDAELTGRIHAEPGVSHLLRTVLCNARPPSQVAVDLARDVEVAFP